MNTEPSKKEDLNRQNLSRDEQIRKRNRTVGLSLAVFVVALAVISYFRAKGLAP